MRATVCGCSCEMKGELLGRYVLEKIEPGGNSGRYAVEDFLRSAGTHGALQSVAGKILPAPLAHVFAGQQVLLELSQNLVLDFDRKVLELGDSVSYFLDFDGGEEFHDLGGVVAAERDHEDGDLLSRRQLLGSELAPTLGNFVNVLHCSPRPL